ncbi:MAG: flagellar basal body rod protein FlgB [Candidatus Marinimicrobia bacterium]|nr:flagellar basal body rod protein FlgB [Candidatus Neomarinimicrobiota bacterium]
MAIDIFEVKICENDMEVDIFGTRHKSMIKNAVDVYNKQHQAIAKNIANVNDPLYKRVETDFSNELELALQNNSPLKSSNEKHITKPHYQGTLMPSSGGSGKVEITKEMADLAENQIRYEFVTKRLGRMFKSLELSIRGRL